MANGIGRLGGVIMPWVAMISMRVDFFSPFLLFAVMSLGVGALNLMFPYDTLGREIS
jgi:hypothetical protein